MTRQNQLHYTFSIIILAGSLILFNPFLLFFQNDDFIHIPLSAKGIWLQHGSFRPVAELFIRIDFLLWEKTAWGYHLTNLLLHIFCSLILYLFSKEIFTTIVPAKQVQTTAIATTTLFYVYGMHSEAVFWILGRSAILAGIFSLLFLYFYLKLQDSFYNYLGCFFFYWLALLTYESAWMLLIYAVMLSMKRSVKRKSIFPSDSKFLIVLLISFISYLLMRLFFTGNILGEYLSAGLLKGDISFLVRNFFLLITRNFLPPLFSGIFILTGFAAIYLTTTIFLKRMKNEDKKNLLFLVFLLLLSNLPYIGLGVDSYGTESERFLYFPSIFSCCILSFIIFNTRIRIAIKNLVYSLLILFHFLALQQAAKNYREAGSVVVQTLNEIKGLEDETKLSVISLPQNQKGAYIFRKGLQEMCDWYDLKIKVNVISHKYELIKLNLPLKIHKSPAGMKGKKTFYYTDSTLIIY